MTTRNDTTSPADKITSLGCITPRDALNLLIDRNKFADAFPSDDNERECLMLLFLHGSWNNLKDTFRLLELISSLVSSPHPKRIRLSSVLVDEDDESMDVCLAKDGLNVPNSLPALAAAVPTDEGFEVNYVSIDSNIFTRLANPETNPEWRTSNTKALQSALTNVIHSTPTSPKSSTTSTTSTTQQIRLFISGDRSNVGKSSICMGLLGSFLQLGYEPDSLAYIKPATQCEATQLVEEYCKTHRIPCVPIGPVVYFKGFTREFLAGRTESSDALLDKAARAVDELAKDKRIVLIDGVGYPSVGSITGTCNASVASRCGVKVDDETRTPVPVVLVGRSGVGDAVDSFNLNCAYFHSHQVPVLGVIYNRVSLEGYYSLPNVKKAVGSYFEQYKPNQKAFGFIPEIEDIAASRESEEGLDQALQAAETFVDMFCRHVNVRDILEMARTVQDELSAKKDVAKGKTKPVAYATKMKENKNNGPILTREQIEQAAKAAGAAGG